MALNLFRRLTVALVVAALAMPLLLIAPAGAQGASPCPAGQPPGRPPGVPPGPPNTPVGPPPGRPGPYTSQSECQLRLGQSTASHGERVEISGAGYGSGSSVELVLNSKPIALGTAVADAGGQFTKTITVPASAPVGLHTITASGVDPTGNGYVLSASFEVTGSGAAAAPSPSGAPTLPRTGFETVTLAIASVLLIGVGLLLVLTARRRRSASITA